MFQHKISGPYIYFILVCRILQAYLIGNFDGRKLKQRKVGWPTSSTDFIRSFKKICCFRTYYRGVHTSLCFLIKEKKLIRTDIFL
jgi:hypothetical protein